MRAKLVCIVLLLGACISSTACDDDAPSAPQDRSSTDTPTTQAAAPATVEPKDQDPWEQVRAAVLPPSVSVYRPGHLPSRFGPPELVAAGAYNYTVVYRAPNELVTFFSGTPEGALANIPGDPSEKEEEVSILGQRGTIVTITQRDPRFLGAFWQWDGRRYGVLAYSNRMTAQEFRQILDKLEEVP